ncbi:MAG: helix-turn-helix domain-containing protein [Kineosporiaceae bacterium]
MTRDPVAGPVSPRPFLNVREAAAELRIDESTLYRHLREGRFPGIKVGGRYLVPAAILIQLAEDAMISGRCLDVEDWLTTRQAARRAG